MFHQKFSSETESGCHSILPISFRSANRCAVCGICQDLRSSANTNTGKVVNVKQITGLTSMPTECSMFISHLNENDNIGTTFNWLTCQSLDDSSIQSILFQRYFFFYPSSRSKTMARFCDKDLNFGFRIVALNKISLCFCSRLIKKSATGEYFLNRSRF